MVSRAMRRNVKDIIDILNGHGDEAVRVALLLHKCLDEDVSDAQLVTSVKRLVEAASNVFTEVNKIALMLPHDLIALAVKKGPDDG